MAGVMHAEELSDMLQGQVRSILQNLNLRA
jgi:hypothetical protein